MMHTTRLGNIDDVEQLAFLFDAYRVFYEKESNYEKARHFLHERISLRESVIFIAENEDKNMTGFVQLYPLFSSTRMQRLWLLNDLFVAPSFRGQGISILLIECAKNHARTTNSCGLMLETARDNSIGNQLYPRVGFTLDAEHNYYLWNI